MAELAGAVEAPAGYGRPGGGRPAAGDGSRGAPGPEGRAVARRALAGRPAGRDELRRDRRGRGALPRPPRAGPPGLVPGPSRAGPLPLPGDRAGGRSDRPRHPGGCPSIRAGARRARTALPRCLRWDADRKRSWPSWRWAWAGRRSSGPEPVDSKGSRRWLGSAKRISPVGSLVWYGPGRAEPGLRRAHPIQPRCPPGDESRAREPPARPAPGSS